MNLFQKISFFALFSLSLSGTALADETPVFAVTRYQVEGNTILPVSDVEQLLTPFTGKNSDFGTLQQAVEALEQAYRSRGFHAVKVLLPEQELTGGTVRLVVLEARIGTVTVEGNKHFDSANIRNSVPRLKEGTVPNLDKISMNIRVANENPARKTQLVLQNGEREDLTNAVLKVTDEKPWKVGMSLDDTGNDQTGKLRLGFLAQYANLFNLDHLLTLQYTTSPDHADKVSIYSLGYRIPLYNWGDSIDLYGGYSDVDSGTVQSGVLNFNVSGRGTFGGVRYNQNLVRLGSYEHRLTYGFDYRVFDNKVDLAGTALGTTTASHPLTIGYYGSYTVGSGSESDVWLALSQNIPGGEYGKDSDYEKLRVDAPAAFTVFRGGGSLRAVLPADMQIRFSVNGQYAFAPLISGEQFGAGGQGSLRGFEERELSNDSGLAGSIECYSPEVMKWFNLTGSQLRGLMFLDVASLWRNKPQPGEESSTDAASTGLGIRLAVARNLVASTDYAFVINPAGKRQVGDGRFHFRIQLTF